MHDVDCVDCGFDGMGWDGMGIGVCVVFAGEEWDDEWDEDMRT